MQLLCDKVLQFLWKIFYWRMLCNAHMNCLGRVTIDWIGSTVDTFLCVVNIEYLDASKHLSTFPKLKFAQRPLHHRFDMIYDLIRFLNCHNTLVPYFLLWWFKFYIDK